MAQSKIVVARTWRKSGANLTNQNMIKKLQATGMKVVEIAIQLDIEPDCVQSWCDHFEAGGPVGYNAKHGVIETKANKPKAKKKKKKAKKKPANAGDDWDE